MFPLPPSLVSSVALLFYLLSYCPALAQPLYQPLSLTLQSSPSFLLKTGEVILSAEQKVWNITIPTLEDVLRGVNLTLVESLGLGGGLLEGLQGVLGMDAGRNDTLIDSTTINQNISLSNSTTPPASQSETPDLPAYKPPFSSVIDTSACNTLPTSVTDSSSYPWLCPSPSSTPTPTTPILAALPISTSTTASISRSPLRHKLGSRPQLHKRRFVDSMGKIRGDKKRQLLELKSGGALDLGIGENDLQVDGSSDLNVAVDNEPDSGSTGGSGLNDVINAVNSDLASVIAEVESTVEGANGNATVVGDGAFSGVDESGNAQSGSARRAPGDLEWYISLTIGNPPQTISVLPDTGSSDLLIFSSTCSGISPSNHTLYDPNISDTYGNESIWWNGGYADGSGGAGWISSEKVPINGSENGESGKDTHLPGMIFALISKIIGDSFDQSAPTGVIGLAQDSLCTLSTACDSKSGNTLFSRLVKEAMLPRPVMSIKLVKSSGAIGGVYLEDGAKNVLEGLGLMNTAGDNQAGYLLLGAVEDGDIVGGENALVWIDVTSHYYWGASFSDVLMGSTSVYAWTEQTSSHFIVDTGTTLIYTSYELAFYIHSLIPGSQFNYNTGIYYIPCTSSYPESPNLFFELGGQRFGVPIGDLAWKQSSDPNMPGMCVSGVQGGGPGFTVLGDMWIKNAYVVLSYGSSEEDTLQIGVGKRTDVAPIL